jgi:hypothetical protein
VLGRVNAGFRVSFQAAMLGGALVGGVLGEVIGLRTTLVLASLLQIGAAAVIALSPAWSARQPQAKEFGVGEATAG